MRFADDNQSIHRQYHFQPRERMPTVYQCVFFCAATCFLMVVSYVLAGDLFGFACVALVLTALCGAGLIWSVQQHRDITLATEFQNALFSAALGLGTLFVLFVRKDGTVVYADRGFHAMYPRFTHGGQRTIDRVIDIAQISKDDGAAIVKALMETTEQRLVLDVRDTGGILHKVVLTMDPVHWPQDFVMLRARTFVEQRKS
jgi:hypothetical protein